MPQNIDKFYGLRIQAHYDIEISRFDGVSSGIREAVSALDLGEQQGYGIYISRLLLQKSKNTIFGLDSLEDRLEYLNLKFEITKKNRHTRRLFFLNHRISPSLWLFTSEVDPKASMYDIVTTLSGSWCSHESLFEMFVVTAVHRDLPSSKRKINVCATAFPTAKFRGKFHNSDGIYTTTVSYDLISSVQLALEFPIPQSDVTRKNVA